MNRKQLIVAWCVGIIIGGAIFFAPYKSIGFGKIPIYKDSIQEKHVVKVRSEIETTGPSKLDFSDLLETGEPSKLVGYRWGLVKVKRDVRSVPLYLFRIILPILIVGGLSIYSLRDKKK